jgi:uncharacterized protein (DUF2336 family)
MQLASADEMLDDIRSAFAARDSVSRHTVMDSLTDLFVGHADRFSASHVAVFDQVILLLSEEIEMRARARLAERLSEIANAPPRTVKKLALDDITVARPVLAKSAVLSDQDLLEVGRSGGRDHMLAISERKNLTELVTDMLVNDGDRVVVNAVASNPTARFSMTGYDQLVNRSQTDELLQAALGRRDDVPQRHMTVLFELAKKAARDRLQGELSAISRRTVTQAVNEGARDVAVDAQKRSEAYSEAVKDVTMLMQHGALGEPMLLDFARRNQQDHTMCALSCLANISPAMAERALLSSDNDLLLIVSRSIDLGWPTVKAMFNVRKTHRPSSNQLEGLAEAFGKLGNGTAQRVLRFLQAKETASVKPRG